ncbi:hypothetical protein ACQ4PT_013508 [Festuca glaucescens]
MSRCAATDSAVTRSCGDNSTTASSSTYQANLQLLSAALPKNASSLSLYARGSAGSPDAAYGLALCRGDTANASVCGGCVTAAFREALRLCGPASNDTHVVYEACAIHVSIRDFVYRTDDVLGGLLFVSDPPLPGSDPADAESANSIGGLVDVLLRETGKQAAYDSTTRYATARMDVNITGDGALPALYSLAQCVPDLRPVDCWGCLHTINGMASTRHIKGGSSELMFFSFSQVSDATSNFSNENKLGQGGFGPVYKGQLADGSDVAIKRLASHSVQGLMEFKNEVQLIAKLQHTNLVRLMGCYSHGEEKILIYEYLPNKSLDFFIFGTASHNIHMLFFLIRAV